LGPPEAADSASAFCFSCVFCFISFSGFGEAVEEVEREKEKRVTRALVVCLHSRFVPTLPLFLPRLLTLTLKSLIIVLPPLLLTQSAGGKNRRRTQRTGKTLPPETRRSRRCSAVFCQCLFFSPLLLLSLLCSSRGHRWRHTRLCFRSRQKREKQRCEQRRSREERESERESTMIKE